MKEKLFFKTLIWLMISGFILINSSYAQVPVGINYQAVVRDQNNSPIIDQLIGIRVSILKNSTMGIPVYIETHNTTTNLFGLFTIVIGQGTPSLGTMDTIRWEDGDFFIQVEIDIVGGINYTLISTQKMLSVPYAFHAASADNLTGSVKESDPIFLNSPSFSLSSNDIVNLSNLSGINTGDQDLTQLVRMTDLNDSITAIRNDIPDVSGLIETETDPLFLSWNKDYNDLINVPVLWDSSYSSIKNTPDLSVYATKDMNNGNITNMANPVNMQDVATKAYVDNLLLVIQILQNGITDVDGNHYDVVLIGSQLWMKQNLRTIKYKNNVLIPKVTDNTAWSGLTTPAYCWYNNDSVTYAATYGAIYNWYTVNTNDLCPSGWHVPNDAEWQTLIDYAGLASVAGGKLKETGFAHWNSPNTGATNEFAFTALPGGKRTMSGPFGSIGTIGYWWSRSNNFPVATSMFNMLNSSTYVDRIDDNKKFGVSVRCLKD